MKKRSYHFFGLGFLLAWTLTSTAFAQPTNYSSDNANGNANANAYQQFSNAPDAGKPSNANSNQQFSNTPNAGNTTLRIGVVNAKKALEESKLGKQEQANFEKMKQQMESVLQKKAEELKEVEEKLNDDDDLMDSLSDEALSELKRKRRTLRQDGMQMQGQFMQTLQEANVKIIQRLTETIAKASEQVAKNPGNGQQPIDVIFTDEATTYVQPRWDVTQPIIVKMNEMFDAEQKNNGSKQR